MPTRPEAIVQAFHCAAAELGFAFEAPVEVDIALGQRLQFLGVVRDFGARNGTILSTADTTDSPDLRSLGYFTSALSSSYEQYDRHLFVATLNDWGFYGRASDKPSWYTGRPWT
jgi:hypothetical protein